MSRLTTYLQMALNFSGMIRMRQSLADNFNAIDEFFSNAATPKITTDATQSITLTAADHFTDANGKLAKDATLYTTNASAVAASMTKTESDKLALGTKLWLVQSAGAVTITGSGGVTFTRRGTATGGLTAVAIKVTSALWLVDYGTPHA